MIPPSFMPSKTSLPHLEQQERLKRHNRLRLLKLLRSQQECGGTDYSSVMNSPEKFFSQTFSPLPTRHSSPLIEPSPLPLQGGSFLSSKNAFLQQPSMSQYPFKTDRKETELPHLFPSNAIMPARKVPKGIEPVLEISDNDVLSGRGGATNVHPGNKFFRSLIDEHREKYLRARKNDKPDISRSIVSIIRKRNGAFLKKDEKTNQWFEIGDDLAREKTSQALRQRAPDHRRRLIQEEAQRIQLSSNAMPSLSKGGNSALQTSINRDDLMLGYLAMKKKRAELQYRIELVESLKRRMATETQIY
jgi:hypothetical protein